MRAELPNRPVGKARDPLWDNLRLVAIALVVIGHAIEAAGDYDPAFALYAFLYAFHMPLFALISGYFARAEPLTVRDGQKIVAQLLVPYVIFSVLWSVLRWPWEGHFTVDLASPYWHLWFLPALAIWRLSLPLFAATRWPVVLSVLVACVSGYFASVGWVFDASRVLTMVPFFVAGWTLAVADGAGAMLDSLRKRVVRVAAAGVLAVALLGSVLLVDGIRSHRLRQWLQAERNYASLEGPFWMAGLIRLLLIGLALVLVLACVSLTPARRLAVTHWGTTTMYVYLLHLAPIYLLQQTSFYQDLDRWQFVALLIGAVLLVAALSSPPVRSILRPLVEPSLGWLFARAKVPSR